MTTHYARGAAFERRTAGRLRGLGYYVTRAAGSHGVDLHATRRDGTLLVNCKTDRHNIARVEWNVLVFDARRFGATPVIADQTGPRHTLRLWLVMGPRANRQPVDDCCEPWTYATPADSMLP